MDGNKKLVSIIVVLTILVIGLGGFIVYDKVLSKSETKEEKNNNTNNTNNTEEQFTSIAVDDQRVLNTLYIIDNNVSTNVYEYRNPKVETITASDLTPAFKKALAFSLDKLENTGRTVSCDSYRKYDGYTDAEEGPFYCGTDGEGPDMETTIIYDETELLKSVEKYFGKNSYVSGSFLEGYVENHKLLNGEYFIQTASAGDWSMSLIYKVKDAKVSDTTLIYNVLVDSECSSMEAAQEYCTLNYDYNYELTFKKDSEGTFRFEKLVKTLNK